MEVFECQPLIGSKYLRGGIQGIYLSIVRHSQYSKMLNSHLVNLVHIPTIVLFILGEKYRC